MPFVYDHERERAKVARECGRMFPCLEKCEGKHRRSDITPREEPMEIWNLGLSWELSWESWERMIAFPQQMVVIGFLCFLPSCTGSSPVCTPAPHDNFENLNISAGPKIALGNQSLPVSHCVHYMMYTTTLFSSPSSRSFCRTPPTAATRDQMFRH